VLINKALVYGLLTGTLIAVYAGCIIGLEALLWGLFNQTSEIAIVVCQRSTREWLFPNLSEPACYGRHKREGNPRTCLNGRKVRREEKHEAQTEEERALVKGYM
jgi:hypothetical protein